MLRSNHELRQALLRTRIGRPVATTRNPGQRTLTAAEERPRNVQVASAITYVALAWGMSFFLIRESLNLLDPFGVAFARAAVAAGILAAIPASRTRIPWRNHGPIVLLAIVWMALPMTLFAVAEQHLDSAIAGVVNGSAPLFTAIVAAILHHRLPRTIVVFGLLAGFSGVLLVCLSSLDGGGANSSTSVALVLVAVALYGIAFNIAGPLQRRYGALPVVMRAMWIAALLLVLPGMPSVLSSTPDPVPIAAVLALGAFSTGGAFVVFAWLSGRTDPTRASVATYFVPIVATVVGTIVGGEDIRFAVYIGIPVILVGAWIVQSRNREA